MFVQRNELFYLYPFYPKYLGTYVPKFIKSEVNKIFGKSNVIEIGEIGLAQVAQSTGRNLIPCRI